MAKDQVSTADVLRSARQMLEIAQMGVADFEAAGERRTAGLFNAVTSGRSVTFVLQKLRTRAEGFEQWYQPVQQRLKADATGRWFVELRNRIEKEGTHGPSTSSLHIENLDTGEMMRQAPPNATGMFLGDSQGRSGWIVQTADGTEVEVFFKFPGAVTGLHIDDAPGDEPVEKLLPRWISQLDEIVTSAEQRFGGASR